MAQRVPKGPIYLNVALEHMLHDWTPPAQAREVPTAPTDAGAARGRGADRRAAARGEEPGDRRGGIRARSQGVHRAGRARRPARHPGDQRARQHLREFPDRSPALSGHGQVQAARRRRPGAAGGRARALVPGAPPADQRQDRRHPRQPAQGPPHLSELARGPLPRRRRSDLARAHRRAARGRQRSTPAPSTPGGSAGPASTRATSPACAPSRRRRARAAGSTRSPCSGRSARCCRATRSSSTRPSRIHRCCASICRRPCRRASSAAPAGSAKASAPRSGSSSRRARGRWRC